VGAQVNDTTEWRERWAGARRLADCGVKSQNSAKRWNKHRV